MEAIKRKRIQISMIATDVMKTMAIALAPAAKIR